MDLVTLIQSVKMKYKKCRPEKRIYRNLALGIISFFVLATVLPVIATSGMM